MEEKEPLPKEARFAEVGEDAVLHALDFRMPRSTKMAAIF